MERDVASVVRACSDHRKGDRICMQRLMCERVSKFFETSKKNSGRGNRLVKVLDGRKGAPGFLWTINDAQADPVDRESRLGMELQGLGER